MIDGVHYEMAIARLLTVAGAISTDCNALQINVGRQEVALVLRVDKDKGYIDLSKRRVSPEDIEQLEEKYNRSKAVHRYGSLGVVSRVVCVRVYICSYARACTYVCAYVCASVLAASCVTLQRGRAICKGPSSYGRKCSDTSACPEV